ncbi:retrovirus-related pol polyprotein from transposon TNT 1-94 [Tanacetum coccineum]
MMLLARAITQKFSTPTNNRLHTSSNTRNPAMIQDGRVDIQTKNAGYGGNGNRNAGRQNRNQAFNARNGNDESNQIAVSEVNASNKVHEQVNHAKRKTIIHTSDDDKIDSNIIFDYPYVENNGGTSEPDSNAHDEYHDIQMLPYNVQREAKNQKKLKNELKKKKELLQKEFETFKDQVKSFESKTIQCSKYKETCEELEREIRADMDTIERILKEKDKTEKQENQYLDNIVDLEEKLSSHDRIVYKMGQSIQTIHMLGKQPNKVYDPFLKAGTNLKIDSPDSEKTLDYAEESRLKMRNKIVQLNYGKLNALYEAFVPQQESSVEQTYFSFSSTSNDCSESKDVTSDLTIPKMPKESELNNIKTIEKEKNVNTKFDKSDTLGTLLCVTPWLKYISVKAKKVSNTKVNADRSKPVTSHSIPKMSKVKNRVRISNSVGRPKSKDTKSNDRVLKNTNDKRSSAHVRKMSSSVSIDSNKCETMNSIVCQPNASVLNTKTVNDINDGSNIFCVSCGKDVFLLSHEKCVTCYALSRESKVKRALFTTPVAAKSRNLGATSVVAKSRFSVAKTPTATNKVIQLILWIVDSGCSNHMIGNLQLLRNFIEKFMETVRFGNDHFAAITGYGDYVQGNLTICHVYYVEVLGYNLFSIEYFYDGDLEALILKIQNDNGTEFKNEKLRSFYGKLGILHNTSIARIPQQNGVVERRNHTLVEAARTMLIFLKTSEFLWAEVIATTCFTQNRSIVHTQYNKTLYELIRGRKPNVQYFHVFGSLCYLTNDRDDLGKMKSKAGIRIFIRYSESSRVIGACSPNFWSISAEKIAYLDRWSLKLQCANWILPYRFLGQGLKNWLDARHHELTPPIGTNLIAILTMPPKRRSQNNPTQTSPEVPLTLKSVNQLVREGVEEAIRAEWERVRLEATRGPAEGPVAAPVARECTFSGFNKCGPTPFHRTEGAVGLIHWFEKMESTFGISECAKGKKVKFVVATLNGRALI